MPLVICLHIAMLLCFLRMMPPPFSDFAAFIFLYTLAPDFDIFTYLLPFICYFIFYLYAYILYFLFVVSTSLFARGACAKECSSIFACYAEKRDTLF